MNLYRYKPAVSRNLLLFTAGILWTAVGLFLCLLAAHWLRTMVNRGTIYYALSGIVMAAGVYKFGFSKIAQKNINRVCQYPDRVCFFAFQEWRSYLIISVMAPLGIFLRHSSLPRQYLATIYITIGLALFLSSLHYYFRLSYLLKQQNPCQKV
ncbi:MAG: hypothetical protein P8048_06185 [Calditrichia bacterium]